MATRYQQAEKREAGQRVFPPLFPYEVGHDVGLQVINLYKRYVSCQCKSLGK